jgi:hypothetical protein
VYHVFARLDGGDAWVDCRNSKEGAATRVAELRGLHPGVEFYYLSDEKVKGAKYESVLW